MAGVLLSADSFTNSWGCASMQKIPGRGEKPSLVGVEMFGGVGQEPADLIQQA
jgi:hypothetical protein